MERLHLLELEDQAWFPEVLRDAGVAYLRFVADLTGQPDGIRPLVESALERSGEKEILDLCSGGGGPAISIVRALWRSGRDVRLTLSDFFPSESARARVASEGDERIRYLAESVDATATPPELAGLRTFFNAFHHFRPEAATRILAGAVADGRPIVAVEVLQRRIPVLIGICFSVFVVPFVVPFLRPFRLAWIPFTYLIPAIPLLVLWDGLVSTLRIHDRDELLGMTAAADPDGEFDWRVEEVPLPPAPVPGIALTGIPKSVGADAGPP